MKIPNEFYPSLENTDHEFLYSPRQVSMNNEWNLNNPKAASFRI